MKRILLMTLAVAFALNMSAQQNGLPQFLNKTKGALDPSSIAGLYIYDTDGMLDKIKVRKAAKKALVGSIINDYNAGLNGLKIDNMNSLVGLGMDFKNIIVNKTFMELWNARSDYKGNIANIRETRNELHHAMETELTDVLTKRQKRKWYKYSAQLENDLSGRFDMGDLFTYVGM